MDPNATLRRILDSLETLDTTGAELTDAQEDAVGSLRDLSDWLSSGGFSPDVRGECLAFVERAT